MWSEERLTKIQAHQGPTVCGQKFGQERRKLLNVKRNGIGLSKSRSSTKLESSGGLNFIDPDDMEFKDTIVNARKKLESSADSATPCKVQNLGHGEFCSANEPNTRRSKCACIVEAFHASTRKRTGKTQQIDHEYRIAVKG